MKLRAALKQRVAFRVEIGFCSTKFAPIWNACWVVTVPFRMAKVTEFLLLGALRKPSSTRKPPSRSSQSTMMASNFSVRRISSPELTPRQTSTSMDSFSGAVWRTRMTSASRLRSSDSNRYRIRMVVFWSGDSKVTKVIPNDACPEVLWQGPGRVLGKS